MQHFLFYQTKRLRESELAIYIHYFCLYEKISVPLPKNQKDSKDYGRDKQEKIASRHTIL